MKIFTILDHIDNGHMALPEFQRGYVWNRDQVRGLFGSLYRRHPVGGLLVWATESKGANHRGDNQLASGIVKLLLDGQQRMTSIYGVVRGKAPKFFDGSDQAFIGLRFNLETEAFEFYQPVTMRDDPLWIDVSKLFQSGQVGIGEMIKTLTANPAYNAKLPEYIGKLSMLLGITDIDLHIEEVTGGDKSLDVVVDIFNKVNSGGTKLSKGDLALAKICADWPEARSVMKAKLSEWDAQGYEFNLDWLLRSINTTLTGEAKFLHLEDKSAEEIKSGLKRATKHIETALNMIAGRLGLDHARVLFGRFAVPVMVRYIDQKGGPLDEKERDKLLFWFAQAGMWGRYSGSTESYIDKDLEALEGDDGGLDKMLEQLRLWHGGMKVEPDHFTGWSRGARFYPVLYMLTRMGEAKDWGTGLPLKANLLGKLSRLEVHHIFPKSRLYQCKRYSKSQINAVSNFCFLTKDTNLDISNRLPEEYFPEVEKKHPGALASQWIPMNKNLWRIENYEAFMEERKSLLAAEANNRFAELLHGDERWLDEASVVATQSTSPVIGGVSSDEEEREIAALNSWVKSLGLPQGEMSFDYSDAETGVQKAVFDLAWPDGLQPGLSQPVAVFLNEGDEIFALADAAGFRCFRSGAEFRQYVEREIVRHAA
jgi:hypothetical protein